MEPELIEVRNGWAAVGDYWAVFGHSKEEAIHKFRKAEQKHKEIAMQIPIKSDYSEANINP